MNRKSRVLNQKYVGLFNLYFAASESLWEHSDIHEIGLLLKYKLT